MGTKIESFDIELRTLDGNKYGWSPDLAISINLDNLVDRYDYHDFPSTVETYLSIEQMEKLSEFLIAAIDVAKSIKVNPDSRPLYRVGG